MAISNVVERNGFVYIYDDAGNNTGTVGVGSGPDDGLKGYTSSSVNVRSGSWIYSYDERGIQTNVVPA